MKVNRKGALAFGALITGSMLALAGCAGGSGGTASPETRRVRRADRLGRPERADALRDVCRRSARRPASRSTSSASRTRRSSDDFIRRCRPARAPTSPSARTTGSASSLTNGVVAPIELGDNASEYLDVAISASLTTARSTCSLRDREHRADAQHRPHPRGAGDFDDMIAKGTAAGTKSPVRRRAEPRRPTRTTCTRSRRRSANSVFGADAEGYDGRSCSSATTADSRSRLARRAGRGGRGQPDLTQDLAKEDFLGRDPVHLTGPWNVAMRQVDGASTSPSTRSPARRRRGRPAVRRREGLLPEPESENKVAANEFLVNYIGTEDVQTRAVQGRQRPPALKAAATRRPSRPDHQGLRRRRRRGCPDAEPSPRWDAVWESGASPRQRSSTAPTRPPRGRSWPLTSRPRSTDSDATTGAVPVAGTAPSPTLTDTRA